MVWTTCTNPFNFHGAGTLFNSIQITSNFQEKCETVGLGFLSEGQRLCNKCYSEIRHRYDTITFNESLQEDVVEVMDVDATSLNLAQGENADLPISNPTSTDELYDTVTTVSSQGQISIYDAQFLFDACLTSLKLTPTKTGLSNTQLNAEIKHKFFSILEQVRKITEVLLSRPIEVTAQECGDCKILMDDVKKKYSDAGTRKERLQLATSLPRSITIEEIMSLLKVTRGMGKIISKLQNEEGAFSFIEPKKRQKISSETIKKIKECYLSPLHSRILPGQWDTVYSDKDSEGKKERVAKQLMLVTLTELHSEFTQQNTDNPISLSEFAKNCPRQCRWVWNKGQHRTCTCIIHENFKLLLEATCSSKTLRKTHQIISELLCENIHENCWLGLCGLCPREEKIEELFTEILDDDEISFYQWVSTDRTDLLKLCEPFTSFCDRIRRYIPKIALHCYINNQQYQFIENLTNRLITEKAIIAKVDFGQNYAFLIQDAVQSYHWSPPQATIHPFALQYYDDKLAAVNEITYVVISDHLEHNATTFYCFHHEVMVEMKKLVEGLSKVYLVSDGSAEQYKGYKSFCNLLHHEKDYNVKCEHHFNATAHGKSKCDAACGVCKHNARQASKRGEKITNPMEFYSFCQSKLASDKLKFMFISKERIQEIIKELNLEERYSKALTIPGSRSAHAFQPSLEWPMMLVKQFSSAETGTEFSIFEVEHEPERIRPIADQYVAFVLENIIRVGRVKKIDIESGDVKLQPLINVKGKVQNRFSSKEFSVEMWVINSALLCIVSPPVYTTVSGRQYRLEQDDFVKASHLLQMRHEM